MNFKDFLHQFEHKQVFEKNNSACQNPLVSICVQTYNQENYIQQCLESLVQQKTSFPFEILIGEDDSNDKTRAICTDYAEKYPHLIRLFYHSRKNNIAINGNPTSRFNYMYNFYSARGKYIALCEGDDYWIDDYKLEKQVQFLEDNTDYSICFCKILELLPNGKLIKERVKIPAQTTTAVDLAFQNYLHTPGIVLKNIWLNKEIPDFFSALMVGDFPMNLMVAETGKIFQHPDTMAVYRAGVGVFSSTGMKKRYIAELQAFGPFMNYFKQNTIKKELAKRFIHLLNELKPLLPERDLDSLLTTSLQQFSAQDKTIVIQQLFAEQRKTKEKLEFEPSYRAKLFAQKCLHFLSRMLKK